ncbi:S41 family peptidase [Sphingomonas sp. URHD0057]|uniref:S41 family peptidase n=1 Tax=Sphingomonas sp. URHD0057 TaxID=1380389 RepID=UPI00068905DA|nr:S41 family peptidase [Sphingomonas sp. URHD0057]
MQKTGLASALLLSATLAVPAPVLASVQPASPAAAPTNNDIEELDTFMDVYERVKARYVKDVDAHTLVKGAIDGMLAALDPHSSYAEGNDFDDLQTISDGDYGGLGLVTTIDGGFVRVVSTTEDAPAWKAGVKPKDFITHIDGKLLYGLSLDEATSKLRGMPGSKVQLTVRRDGVSKPIAMTITRDVIEVKPVKWEVRKNVGIINLNIFNGKAGEETRNALLAINSATHDAAVGYILDLRSNGGGVVDEAVDIADLFLESGEIVSRRGRESDSNQHYYARPGDLAHGRPVIVLVDSGTASASEIVAGALQDHHRALIVGEQSFGKGSVQSIYPMGSKRALRLTTELYYLPSGRSIQGEGIDPDILVPQLSDGDLKGRINVRESDLRRHLIADVPVEDADLIASDPVAARFTVTKASLKSRGVADFQLDYALNILNRLAPPTNIADRRGPKTPNG